jgi:phosphoglycerol transferase MdoB-like AlkP superfamily enzyme
MFYRSAWYPDLGFDQTWFGPALEKIGLPRCRGAFPGICDTAIAKWMGTSLLGSAPRGAASDKHRFIYWDTLNSHIPVPARPDLPDDGVCATQPALLASAALCSWFQLVRAVHQSVSQLAVAVNDRPTVCVLVGDHAPPFGEPQLRNQFSSAQVPYLMLTPRQPCSR